MEIQIHTNKANTQDYHKHQDITDWTAITLQPAVNRYIHNIMSHSTHFHTDLMTLKINNYMHASSKI